MGLDRFFRRPPVADTEQWQPGDTAECIIESDWIRAETGEGSPGPRLSEMRAVTKVRVMPCPIRDETIVRLGFDRYPGGLFDASCFRKVHPSADEPIAAETAFTDLIRKQPERCPAGESV